MLLRHYIGPKKPQIWCYIMVSFLNHIPSILSERGLRCGAVYYPLFIHIEIIKLLNIEIGSR